MCNIIISIMLNSGGFGVLGFWGFGGGHGADVEEWDPSV